MLEEIFKTNPELLNTPEVKALIAYVEGQQKKQHEMWKKETEFRFEVMRLIWNSEICYIKGRPAGDTIEKILALDNGN